MNVWCIRIIIKKLYYVNGVEKSLSPDKINEYKSQNIPIFPTEMAHDVDRIQVMYGKREISRRVIDYFRARLLRNYT